MKTETERDISLLHLTFINNPDENLHFIIDEKKLNLDLILSTICLKLCDTNKTFDFKPKQRLALLKNHKLTYSKSALKAFLSPYTIRTVHPQIELDLQRRVENLNKYIPISNYKIERAGNLLNRISSFQNIFKACNQSDFFNNEKLLVIGNRNLFLAISKEYPASFVSEDENGNTEIEYNSPILPKIAILKNINLLDNYLQQEINGGQVTFSTCIFVGSSKFENSINIIRNYYNQGRFKKLVFIGEKDIKLDLGNNQIPLRWKWTIPEINFFKGERNIQHHPIVIHNNELENAITEFYQAIREIESKHTISLKSIYRFIRRLYYDWNLKQETTLVKLQQIQQEFDIALKQLLIETLGNIFPDFYFDEYQKPLAAKFAAIIKAVKTNNKNEKLKSYQSQIHQLVLPSFLCNANKAELNEIAKQSQHHVPVKTLQDITHLQNAASQHLNNPSRNFFSLTANGTKTEILSYSKSDDSNGEQHKVISSIYGSGKVEKLIERLGRAKSEYKLLLYGTEESAYTYHENNYKKELNKEYSSKDRFEICGIEYTKEIEDDNSTMDEWIEDISLSKYDQRYTENYQLTFSDNKKIKLPATKSVLKLIDDTKEIVIVEELSSGDIVQIYSNPDKETLRTVFELKYPELLQKAESFSALWQNCLVDYYRTHVIPEKAFFDMLVANQFSVSINTLRRYLTKQVFFPSRYIDLIAIAKTIQDTRMTLEFVRNSMIPAIHDYEGKLVKEGFSFSEGINHYLITREINEYLSQWYSKEHLEEIVKKIEPKTIKDIELITQNNDD